MINIETRKLTNKITSLDSKHNFHYMLYYRYKYIASSDWFINVEQYEIVYLFRRTGHLVLERGVLGRIAPTVSIRKEHLVHLVEVSELQI